MESEMQRIPFPADVCPEPTARYRRTLAEAFPCGATDAIAFYRCRPRVHYGRWLALILAAIVLAALAGCTAQAAEEHPLTKQELSAARACPRGHTAIWIDQSTIECWRVL